MELKLYLRMLQRSWWIVALTTLAAVTVALVNAYLAVPQYSTQARFLISPSKLLNATDFTRLLEGGNFVPTLNEIWNSSTIFDSTGVALQMDPHDLNDYSRSSVTAPSAQVIELTVTGPNPEQAALIANTLGGFAMAKTNDSFGSVVSISVLDAAYTPDRPFSPQPARDAGLALALGLVIGSVLAIGREQLRIPLEALRRRTTTDSESAAFNHTYFQRNIEDELARNRVGQVSLGLVQLSGLTDLYENMPPLVKQRLMRYVTKTLQKELRGSDSVGRWTDTTFGVLLPATPAQPAMRTLERIQRALTRPVEIDKGDRLDLMPYVGLAVVSGDEAATTLIAQAEAALNEARHSGQSLKLYEAREGPPPQSVTPPPEPAPTVETVKSETTHAVSAYEAAHPVPDQDEIVQTRPHPAMHDYQLAESEPVQIDTQAAEAEHDGLMVPQTEATDDQPAELEPAQITSAESDAEHGGMLVSEAEAKDGQPADLEPVQLTTHETDSTNGASPEPESEKDESIA